MLVSHVLAKARERLTTIRVDPPVRMTRDVVVCREREWLADAWARMKARRLPRLPALDEKDQPIGILYARDILQALLAQAEDHESLLRDYVMGVGYHRAPYEAGSGGGGFGGDSPYSSWIRGAPAACRSRLSR